MGARAQEFGQNKVQYRSFDWHILPTKHFDIYYYPGAESLASVVATLAEEAQDKLTVDLKHKLSRRVPILLYASHGDFEQTNVTLEPLDEGIGGFTEVFKNRVVLPFMGSYFDLRHVLVHELTHAFMFDLMYGGPLESLLTRQYLFQLPLWFNEGLAEYLSIGWDSEADMFLRDGAIHGYLQPLDQLYGGYLTYKQGQAAIKYLVDTYGADKLREVIAAARSTRSLDRAFQKALGMSVQKFSDDMLTDARKRYWPEIARRTEGEPVLRRLSDHVQQRNYLNVNPAVSPDGGRVAFLSDRGLATDIYVASAATGEVERRLVEGERSASFEAFHILRTSLCWSPDGQRIAFTAKSGRSDVLYLLDVARAKVTRRIRIPHTTASFPAWSPDGGTIAYVGLINGQTDIYLLTLATGATRRMTNDLAEERDLTWSPDGERLAFAGDRSRATPRDLRDMAGRTGRFDIFALRVRDGDVQPLVESSADVSSPAWSPDGRLLAYVSTANGTPNLYVRTLDSGRDAQVTDVLGGIYSPSWARGTDRLVVSQFVHGGWDIYVTRVPLGSDSTFTALAAAAPSPPMGVARPGSVRAILDLRGMAGPDPGDRATRAVADSLLALTDSVLGVPDTIAEVGAADTVAALPDTAVLARAVAVPHRYKVRFTPDTVTGGLQYSSLIGLGASTQVSLSDILGNHRIFVATDFISSLKNSDAIVLYYSLGKRLDWGGGLFNYRQYYFSSVTPLGEEFSEDRYFAVRNYGGVALASYPFSRFLRVEGDLSYLTVERTDYDPDIDGFVQIGPTSTTRIVAPTVSLVQDNAMYGPFGPAAGSRWQLSYTQGLHLSRSDRRFTSVSADVRKYVPLGRRYTFAVRAVGAASNGPDAQNYFIGGPYTLRGYDFFDFRGTRVAFTNAEFRFPFIRTLDMDWPLNVTMRGIGGVVFVDAGTTWDGGTSPRLTEIGEDGRRRFRDLHASYGTGLRAGLLFFLVKVDFAWRWHLDRSSGMITQVTIGSEF